MPHTRYHFLEYAVSQFQLALIPKVIFLELHLVWPLYPLRKSIEYLIDPCFQYPDCWACRRVAWRMRLCFIYKGYMHHSKNSDDKAQVAESACVVNTLLSSNSSRLLSSIYAALDKRIPAFFTSSYSTDHTFSWHHSSCLTNSSKKEWKLLYYRETRKNQLFQKYRCWCYGLSFSEVLIEPVPKCLNSRRMRNCDEEFFYAQLWIKPYT